MGLGWFGAPEHKRWLAYETHALLHYARAAQVPTGFGWIGQDGEVDPAHPVELWITGRMTFAFSLGALMGIPGCRRYADHGVRALNGPLRDPVNGGWYSAIGPEPDAEGRGLPVDRDARKECYQHAFVLLAAATATAADRPGGHELLRDAIEIQDRYWWDEGQQMPVESYAADFTDPEDYRGINAAMHTVEAYLATADVTGEVRWLERALKITDFAVNVQAREHGWRLPEHYSASWEPRLDYNRDEPAHPFRPYGVTPGHGLEWARLTVQLRGALINRSMSAPDWMLDAAEHIFEQARTDGWRVDGAPGFVYTTDFDGKPMVHERAGVDAGGRRAHLRSGPHRWLAGRRRPRLRLHHGLRRQARGARAHALGGLRGHLGVGRHPPGPARRRAWGDRRRALRALLSGLDRLRRGVPHRGARRVDP